MREMEIRYGGLVKALIARQLEKRRAQKRGIAPQRNPEARQAPADI